MSDLAQPQREVLEYDVVIVGAGPAGLAAACKLRQLSRDISVCVLEKGAEVGAHILSGAILQPTALNELFPDWQDRRAPLHVPVSEDRIYYFLNQEKAIKFPKLFEPRTLRNEGNYIVSLGNVCRWLADQAEQLGVEIYPGFAAADVLYGSDGSVVGVITGDMGRDENGNIKPNFVPGMEIRAKYTLLCEGCRGHLGKQIIQKFKLDADSDPQHYGIGIKELWEIDPQHHQPGLVIHSDGWPCSESNTGGGGFLYHLDNNQVALGVISELAYRNPHYNPYEEMQRWKTHSRIRTVLQGGRRISYGARALVKGGLQSLPKMSFPGGLLLGCDAGTLVNAKIKGSHTAMKSGMLAAEILVEALDQSELTADLQQYNDVFKRSWIFQELNQQRNWGPARHRFGLLLGAAIGYIDTHFFAGKLPYTLRDKTPDHQTLLPADQCREIVYPKPDGKITFSKLDSVYLSNTNHDESQPCHLRLLDPTVPIQKNLPQYNEPAQRYCPAGVYEVVADAEGKARFQINAQNCLHCKTCDIKDPEQNISWVVPEGGGGPNYPNM